MNFWKIYNKTQSLEFTPITIGGIERACTRRIIVKSYNFGICSFKLTHREVIYIEGVCM